MVGLVSGENPGGPRQSHPARRNIGQSVELTTHQSGDGLAYIDIGHVLGADTAFIGDGGFSGWLGS